MLMGSSFSSVAAPYPPPPPAPPRPRWVAGDKAGPTAVSLRLGFLLSSSFKKLSCLYYPSALEDLWLNSASTIKGFSFQRVSNDLLELAFLSSFYFSDRGDHNNDSENKGMSRFGILDRSSFDGRRWTNVLIAVNILFYVAQVASDGKLLFWGAKVNSLIAKGELWRLITSSLLHANLGHLMVNCYSLNSIGPTVEKLTGPRRFLAVYVVSAIASSATSYWLCKAPAVGASGAIFGLVGSAAIFVVRHRGMMGGGKEPLEYIAQVILVNMAIGMLSRGIDNWGHLGGLFGGIATSWLLGPAWRFESLSDKRTKRFVDRAPIKYLTNREPRHHN